MSNQIMRRTTIKPTWAPAVGVLTAAVLTLGGCGGEVEVAGVVTPTASTTRPVAPSTASSTSSTSTGSRLGTQSNDRGFAAGRCLGNKPAFRPMPCSEPHTYEITAVVSSNAHADDPKKRNDYGTAVCTDRTAAYLGSQAWPVTRLQSRLLLPSADDGRRDRFVCMVEEFTDSLETVYTDRTGTMKNKLVGDGFSKYRLCAAQRPSAGDGIDQVSCSKPHAAEAVGGRLNGKPGQSYPGDRKIQSDAMRFCTPVGQRFLGTTTRKDVVVSQNSSGADPWSRGHMLTACFVEVTQGKVTKTMRGIGTKPLSTVR